MLWWGKCLVDVRGQTDWRAEICNQHVSTYTQSLATLLYFSGLLVMPLWWRHANLRGYVNLYWTPQKRCQNTLWHRPVALLPPMRASGLIWTACLSTGERLAGRHPLATGQLPVGGGGVGGVRRVRPSTTEHQTLPLVPHTMHYARHSGLQRAWECVLHGAAEWWVHNADRLSFI